MPQYCGQKELEDMEARYNLPRCRQLWKSRDKFENEHAFHMCGRHEGHRANHKCNCGASKKTDNADNNNSTRQEEKIVSNSESQKSKKSS